MILSAVNSAHEYLSNLNWTIAIDLIVLLTVAVMVLIFFKRRNSIKLALLFSGYLLLYCIIWVINGLFNCLYVTKNIMSIVGMFLIGSFIVVYQTDLKVSFSKLAHIGERGNKNEVDTTYEEMKAGSDEIVRACQNMAKNNVGAIIIICKNSVPSHILDTGTILTAGISCGLLESIFNTRAPLHDGAVVVKGNKILAAGCFLPLSQEVNIAKELGTRHRAAIGITEENNDIFAIVVSEETGVISTVVSGKIKRYMTPDSLSEQIEQAFGISSRPRKERVKEHKFL
ncbi:MAG: DNA integrity scanning protein DisA nucleotide-binding domain protein [Clostridia bacterium]|nr:DNA integrity scanning protein DisA nucleotide-binding domain protein [Clostridia bacterium]